MQGYVAFLDVLGFSAFVNSDESGEKLKTFSECLRAATHPLEVEYVVFSDSIVLTAKGDDENSLFALTQACSNLLAQLLEQNVALRGAIAYGQFQRSQMGESIFVAGRAVIDAYHFEQVQDWVGVMIAPSARERVPDLMGRCHIGYVLNELNKWAFYLQPYDIPFHSQQDGETFDGFAVVPATGMYAQQMLTTIDKAMQSLAWLREIAPTPSAQRKYQRAIRFLDPIRFRWQELAAAEERRNQR